MAIYTFEKNDKQRDFHSSMADYETLEERLNRKGWKRVYVPLELVDQANGDIYSKSDGGWTEVLKKVKKASGQSSTIYHK